jgi:FkbM family methyltransferase
LITTCQINDHRFEIEVHSGTDRWISQSIKTRGIWEPQETAFICETLKPGDTFVDVGANIGWFTILASKIVGESGKVIAYEPDYDNFAMMGRNVVYNGLANVEAHNVALSTEDARKLLFRSIDNMGDHRLFDDGQRIPMAVAAENPCQDWIYRGLVVDFIKSDTQGHEGHVIQALIPYLKQAAKLPTILLEYWPKGITASGKNPIDMVHSLYELGYQATVLPDHPFDMLRHTRALEHSPDFESHINLVFRPRK